MFKNPKEHKIIKLLLQFYYVVIDLTHAKIKLIKLIFPDTYFLYMKTHIFNISRLSQQNEKMRDPLKN